MAKIQIPFNKSSGWYNPAVQEFFDDVANNLQYYSCSNADGIFISDKIFKNMRETSQIHFVSAQSSQLNEESTPLVTIEIIWNGEYFFLREKTEYKKIKERKEKIKGFLQNISLESNTLMSEKKNHL